MCGACKCKTLGHIKKIIITHSKNYSIWQINLLYDCKTSFVLCKSNERNFLTYISLHCSYYKNFYRIINKHQNLFGTTKTNITNFFITLCQQNCGLSIVSCVVLNFERTKFILDWMWKKNKKWKKWPTNAIALSIDYSKSRAESENEINVKFLGSPTLFGFAFSEFDSRSKLSHTYTASAVVDIFSRTMNQGNAKM